MKEIKFRAWDEDSKYFLKGDFSLGIESGEFRSKYGDIYENVIISQFTGLKDAKGVDIYEGDILEFMHHKHKVFRVKGGLVINSHPADWNKDYTPFYEACADMQTAQWMEQCTITGNIYE